MRSEYYSRYYQANKEKIKAKGKAWRESHKDEVREKKRRYYETHRAERIAYTHKHYEANKAKRKAYSAEWKEAARYGITVEEARKIRGQKCGLCGAASPSIIDHNHKKKIGYRGPLCVKDNIVVGALESLLERGLLEKAIEWIKKE